VHQGVDTGFCGNHRGEDAQFLIVQSAKHHLLAPVPKKVGTDGWRSLGPVVRATVLGHKDGFRGFIGPVPLRYRIAVEQLAKQIAIPPHSKVAGTRIRVRDLLPGRIPHPTHPGTGSPAFRTFVAGVDVKGIAPARAFSPVATLGGRSNRRNLPVYLTSSRITHIECRITKTLLDVKHFQAWFGWNMIGEMHGVSMSQPGGVESLAVVVNGTGTVHNLVTTIPIHITHTQVVVSLSAVSSQLRIVVGIEQPAQGELSVFKVKSSQSSPGIVAPAHHHTGILAVQVGHTGQIALGTVAVSVAPYSPELLGSGILGFRMTSGNVINILDGSSGHPVKDGEVLRTAENVSLRAYPFGIGVPDHLAFPVHRTVSRFAHQLSLAIPVQVIHYEWRGVSPLANVLAQVDAPHKSTIQLVSFKFGLLGHAGTSAVAGAHLLLDDDLIVAISIQVGHRAIPGDIPFEGLQRHRNILLHRGIGLDGVPVIRIGFPVSGNRFHKIPVVEGSVKGGVGKIGSLLERSRIKFHWCRPVHRFVQVKSNPVSIGTQQTPAYKSLPLSKVHGHHTPVEFLHLSLCQTNIQGE